MPINFDASASGTYNTAIGTISHTTSGNNRGLTVGIFVESATDGIGTVTYAGGTMTLATKKQNTDLNEWAYLYQLINPINGANNIIVSSSIAVTTVVVSESLTGVAQSGQPDSQGSSATASVTAGTTTLTTVADNAWMVNFIGWAGAGTPSASTGVTARGSSALSGRYIGDSGTAITPPASTSQVWTTNGAASAFTGVAVSFSPSINIAGYKTLLGVGQA